MNGKSERPTWWLLFVIVAALLVLLFLEHALALSSDAHTIVRVAIVGLIFIALWIWYSANERAILNEDLARYRKSSPPRPQPAYFVEEIDERRSRPGLVWRIVSGAFVWLATHLVNLFHR